MGPYLAIPLWAPQSTRTYGNEAKLAADVAERASRTNEPSIDLRVLDEFRVLMGSALAEALECYLADTPVQLSDMSSALVNDDHVALQRCAHSLKSTCATVGAMELKSLAERIEAHARARNSCSDAKALTAAALASFEKVKSHFQALIASERAGVPAGVVAVAQR